MAKPAKSPESVPAWLLWPVRVIGVAVVLPFRLAGTALTAVGRFLSRFVLAPLAWLGRHLIVIPATWAWRTLVVVPLSWLWRTLLVPPGRWLGKALVKLAGWILAIPLILIGVPLMWLTPSAPSSGASATFGVH